MIKNLLFDCSDTLLRFCSKKDLATKLGDAPRAERIHNTFFSSEYWKKFDNGLLSDEEMKEVLLPLFSPEDRRIAEEYFDTFTDHYVSIDGMEELLTELKEKGYKLYIVSDYPPRFPRLLERFEIFRLFDGMAISYQVHGSKKDLRLFSYLLETYSLNPEECLFFDDLPSLVANAEICGIKGHVFTDTEDLRSFLEQMSVL